MYKTINLEKITNGKMMGEIDISAWGWETRYSWGHAAKVTVGYEKIATAKRRYHNRTWEAYRFQSVLHDVICGYVHAVTGTDVSKPVSKRDATPMKNHAAEYRRLARLEARDFARSLYDNLCAIVDGNTTEEQIAERQADRAVA